MGEVWLEARSSTQGFKGFVKDFGVFSKSKSIRRNTLTETAHPD